MSQKNAKRLSLLKFVCVNNENTKAEIVAENGSDFFLLLTVESEKLEPTKSLKVELEENHLVNLLAAVSAGDWCGGYSYCVKMNGRVDIELYRNTEEVSYGDNHTLKNPTTIEFTVIRDGHTEHETKYSFKIDNPWTNNNLTDTVAIQRALRLMELYKVKYLT